MPSAAAAAADDEADRMLPAYTPATPPVAPEASASSSAPAAIAEQAPPAVSLLGPGSSIAQLQARLKELNQPIYGTRHVVGAPLGCGAQSGGARQGQREMAQRRADVAGGRAVWTPQEVVAPEAPAENAHSICLRTPRQQGGARHAVWATTFRSPTTGFPWSRRTQVRQWCLQTMHS